MKIIPYSRQRVDQDDITAVVKILKSDYLTQGPVVTEFEAAFSNYVEAKYCVVFSSGTAALHAIYTACGLTSGDQCITSSLTFAATSNAALYLGAEVKFVDIVPKTGNLDLDKIEPLIGSKTKIITAVHFAGQPVDLAALRKIVIHQKQKIWLIEDACHALGAEFNDKKIGSCEFSDAVVHSFHTVKHITTGEGGAVTTNNKKLYEIMLMFRSHGITKDRNKLEKKDEGDWYHEMQLLGYNYRLTDFQAALGLSQLKKVATFVERRRYLASLYDHAFANNLFFEYPPAVDHTKHAYHLYPIRLKNHIKSKRKQVFSKLRAKGLWVQVHYLPVYLHPYYRKLGYVSGLCPKSEDFYSREISLPLYPSMKDSDLQHVVEVIKKVFHELE